LFGLSQKIAAMVPSQLLDYPVVVIHIFPLLNDLEHLIH